MPTVSYVPVVRRAGFRPVLRYPWAVIGANRRVQGWKLHVSSVQEQAVPLLEAVLPVLRRERVSFKVAQTDAIIALLNEGEFGDTQVGKVMTIYPRSDAEARALAVSLADATREFAGPEIVTDLRLGSVVYARYGSISPHISRDRLGNPVALIEGASALQPDRYVVPFVTPAGVESPFDGLVPAPSHETGRAASPGATHRIGDYLVMSVIRLRAFGGVLLAMDARSQAQASLKALKFGRPFCLSDRHGRDIRDRLRRQAARHAELGLHVRVPAADPYFEVEVDGNGYLPLAFLHGQSFESLAAASGLNRSWPQLSGTSRRKNLDVLARTVDAVAAMHAAGYVHRDLTPSNIWVDPKGEVWLLDLELAHRIGDTEIPFGMGTAGFMSPQQAAEETPRIADDIYAIGSLIAHLIVRLDPRRFLTPTDGHPRDTLARLADGAPRALVDIASACLAHDPADRPDLESVRRAVADAIRERHVSASGAPAARVEPRVLRSVLDAGVRALVAEYQRDGVWRSVRAPRSQGRATTTYDVERHANRGIAGVVYLLARLVRCGLAGVEGREAAAAGAKWLMDTEPAADTRLPGLHFGEAGGGVAIAECVASRVIRAGARERAYIERALTGTLDWPDMTHGAAGQGVAAFIAADRLRDRSLEQRADRSVDYLLQTQSADGSWKLPGGVDGMSGQTLTGFAHGTAGIAWFLAEYHRRRPRVPVRRSLGRAVTWLLSVAYARSAGRHLEWNYGTHTRERWHWWCHGGPGIALTFLKMHELTGERRMAAAARAALDVDRRALRHANLTACHGVSGLGELYLEAARVLDDDEWRVRAQAVAVELVARRRTDDAARVTWLAEDPYLASAGLMVGYGGILHFLARMTPAGRRLGFPLLTEKR